MSRVFVRGWGAVSPAGWGTRALMEALEKNEQIPTEMLQGPGAEYRVRKVPRPDAGSEWIRHGRLRRASSISQFTTAAGLEALGDLRGTSARIGIVVGVHAASIRYSERFLGEVLKEAATASPLLFPETVINAPASHLAAYLGVTGLSYSVLGDQTAFVQALLVGAGWLDAGRADAVLVIGAEETAWTVAKTARLFSREIVCSEGAGAICLTRDEAGGNGVELSAVSDSFWFAGPGKRLAASERMAAQFPLGSEYDLLCDSRTGVRFWDADETSAWGHWRGPVLSPRTILGEALSAGTAWQFVAAAELIRKKEGPSAVISCVGSNQQAIGARLSKLERLYAHP